MNENKKGMNLPNKLTLMRVLLIPFIVIVPLISALNKDLFGTMTTINDRVINIGISISDIIILVIFCVASFTDYLDGHIARKYNLVTDFGKLMDPLADKLLVTATLIVLVEKGRIGGWIVILIVAREFLITGIRQLAVSNNKVIAASKLGKAKTVSQMVMIIILLLNNFPFSLLNIPVGEVLKYVAVGLTVISGVDYFIKNKDLILKSK